MKKYIAALCVLAFALPAFADVELDGDNDGKLDETFIPATIARQSAVDTHTSDTANPHSVTKAQVGLGNVDNTSDTAKPISTAVQSALDTKAAQNSLTTHTGNTANPHGVTKAQVGLGNVDNTSDTAKPISTAVQAALDTKAAQNSLTTHTGSTANPHGVTKAQVGLGNVDNTSDTAKPISAAVQAALDAKATGQLTIYKQDEAPGACGDGDLWVDTNATSGQRIYSCESSEWVLQGGGGTVDLTAPGPIGSVTPNTGAFTSLVAATYDVSPPAIGETGEIGLPEDPANGADRVTLKAPASVTGDLVFTLPSVDGSAGQCLSTDGNGVLSWVACGGQ